MSDLLQLSDPAYAEEGFDSMSNATKTLVTVATYNEMENLPDLVEEILRAVADVDVLVIDDNSPDGTGRWCDEKRAEQPRLRCIHREGKLGLGTATIAAMRYGIEHGYQYVLNMDADFSHHPRYLPDLIAGMEPVDEGPADEKPVDGEPADEEPVDVMIGSRYVPGGGVQGWPLKRHLMSQGVNCYARWLLGLKAKDCSGAFRCYRTATLAKIDFDAIRSRGYSFQEEILWHIKRLGGTFGETPITFVDRQRGASKIDLKESIAALWIILRLGLQNLFGR